MNVPVPISLAFEDALTEALALKTLQNIPTEYATQTIYNSGGNGYLKRTINGFNNAAKGMPFWVGTDLDRYPCPSALIDDWLTQPKHHNLLLRIAVKEAEAWVLADRDSFSAFIGVNAARIPDDVEALPDAKRALINLVRNSRKKRLREDICPSPRSTSRVGPNYNARLCSFVRDSWDPTAARLRSRSLDRTMNRLTAFQPQWDVYPGERLVTPAQRD